MDLALNNQQRLISHKNKINKQTNHMVRFPVCLNILLVTGKRCNIHTILMSLRAKGIS